VIDLSSLKATGWQRVVAELNAPCPDDKTYLERLLRIVCRVSAARQGVVFLPGGDGSSPDVHAVAVWPAPGPGGEERAVPPADNTPIEFAPDARSAAAATIESGQSRAFAIEKKKSALYGVDPGEGGILAIPLVGHEGKPAAAITMLIEPRSKQAVQSTLAMAEVLAGYVSGHAARQQLRRTQTAGFALDLATRLIGSLNTAPNFKGASLQLVNDLAKQFKADRAALGWVKTDAVHVVAMSDTEHFDRRMEMVKRLEAAMDECLDQEQPVVFPAPPEQADALLAQAITHAHRDLASGASAARICSVPLRDAERVQGVVTLEFTGDAPIDLGAVELLQAAMDLLAPVVALRRTADRNAALRAGDDLKRAGAWALGAKHTVWKMVGVAVLAAFLFVTFFTTTYRVGSDATLQPRTKQVISVPFDGLIREVPDAIEAGAMVRAGDLLVQMDTAELELAAQEEEQKIAKAQKSLSAARAENKPHEALKADSEIAIARAALEGIRSRILRSRVVAPIDGQIIAGRLRDRVGSSVKTGDKLFEIAPLGDLLVVARVDERDVALIAPGSAGRLSTRSHPGDLFDLKVESIVPLAQAEEGKNLFEVRAALASPPPSWMRPGMEGIARLDAGNRSLLYIGTRRILDAVRLWLW